jgi:redox-sensing transcriptional repressor
MRDIIFTNVLESERPGGCLKLDSQNVPKPTVKRLAMYHRCLESMIRNGRTNVSSKDIADLLGIKSSQVRKDLSYFGEFGKRGVGYSADRLLEGVSQILGMRKNWNFCIVGMGNLGMALANYAGLEKSGFFVRALFDNNPSKIGLPMPGELTIEPVNRLKRLVHEREISIGVIAVPGEVAQEIVDLLIASGVRGIINFAPVRLSIPEGVSIEDIDISVTFRSLAFSMSLDQVRQGKRI